MLELDEGKLSRPVLRRGDGSNPGSLAGGHAIPTGSTVPTLLNVALRVGREVFGQHADRIASQPQRAGYGGARLWMAPSQNLPGKSLTRDAGETLECVFFVLHLLNVDSK